MNLWGCSQAWEGRAYDYCMENLKNMGFPVDGLSFDPELVMSLFLCDGLKGSTLLVLSQNMPSLIIGYQGAHD